MSEEEPLYIKLVHMSLRDMRRLFKEQPSARTVVGFPTVTYREGGEWRFWPEPAEGYRVLMENGKPHSVCVDLGKRHD